MTSWCRAWTRTLYIIKIHDFSENYTCLLPDEIQSLHWTQETATVYPVVVLRRVNGDVREDHITFISNDKNHDVPFVELCNNWLHKHYQDQGVEIVHDVEYNDGCSSQFKCIRAFSPLLVAPSVQREYFVKQAMESRNPMV